MSDVETAASLLAKGADASAAIRAPGRVGLDYAGLRMHCRKVAAALRAAGIGPRDRVAILLPNGPEMATAFLGTALAAVAAPLNPAYRREELDFYLSDLDAKAVLVNAEETGPIVDAATARGTPLLRLSVPQGARAGEFALAGEDFAHPVEAAAPNAEALVLHTSGTTSRPKQVPLTQANLVASARAIAATLELTEHDAGLSIMPLFHIHGLIACLLAPLSAGGATICTPGFNALRFMGWLQAERPTWYSGVPTMHQAILERAQRQPELAHAAGLRFVRSSSASLPPPVFVALGQTFGCPVIEAYGMTEATHQMASNPLGAGRQKAGSVGRAAGPEIAIASPDGALQGAGSEGEIVIRGPSVTLGYVANAKANAEAFFDAGDGGGRWFRTGDLGAFDAEGYLSISGRIKELINRGGEKIAPREVDEVLLGHPAVAQAVTFALPHDKLGEEVAAAVVLKEGAAADEAALRAHAAAKLAAFKVPRKIVIVTEIPKGATGKLQRIGLGKLLGLA